MRAPGAKVTDPPLACDGSSASNSISTRTLTREILCRARPDIASAVARDGHRLGLREGRADQRLSTVSVVVKRVIASYRP